MSKKNENEIRMAMNGVIQDKLFNAFFGGLMGMIAWALVGLVGVFILSLSGAIIDATSLTTASAFKSSMFGFAIGGIVGFITG